MLFHNAVNRNTGAKPDEKIKMIPQISIIISVGSLISLYFVVWLNCLLSKPLYYPESYPLHLEP